MGRVLRRNVLIAAAALLAQPLAVQAQPRARVYRIGFLSGLTPGEIDIDDEMRALGFDLGRNCIIEYRYAYRDRSKLPGFAADLVKLKVDVIMADLPPSIVAARRATSSIPIVMIWGMSPMELGLIETLARPGGNVTGTVLQGPETTAKTIEVIRDMWGPKASVAMLYEPHFPGLEPYMRQCEHAATQLGLRYRMLPIRSVDDLDNALLSVAKDRPNAFLMAPTGTIGRSSDRLLKFALDQRIPAISTSKWQVRRGALLALEADGKDIALRAIAILEKVLKGANPAEIPVEEPTRIQLWINRKTANTLGIKIPQIVLLQADQIFN